MDNQRMMEQLLEIRRQLTELYGKAEHISYNLPAVQDTDETSVRYLEQVVFTKSVSLLSACLKEALENAIDATKYLDRLTN